MELQNQVKQTREALDEHVARLSKQVDTYCFSIHSKHVPICIDLPLNIFEIHKVKPSCCYISASRLVVHKG